MAPRPARPRDLHRPRDRRAVRPGDRVRRRRHDDRADRRPRDGAAAAQPVPGAPPDRALARGRDAGRVARRQRGRHGGAGAGAAARLGNGVRAAAAARDGHQPHHRRRVGRGGGGCAHRRRQRAAGRAAAIRTRTTTWPSCPTRPATSRCWPLRGGGEYTVRPIHPDDAQMLQDAGARALAREPLLPLRLVDDRAAAVDAGALHADRLRPRDGAGGGGQGAQRRGGRRDRRDRAHRRRVALHHQPRPVELRVLAGGGRRLQRQGRSARA